MNKEQEVLYERASDLWYSLHEGGLPFVDYSPLVREYLALEVALIRSLSDEQRVDFSLAIEHEPHNARNVTYSIITAISAAKQYFPRELNPSLDRLLSAVVNAFSTPHHEPYWSALYREVETFSSRLLAYEK